MEREIAYTAYLANVGLVVALVGGIEWGVISTLEKYDVELPDETRGYDLAGSTTGGIARAVQEASEGVEDDEALRAWMKKAGAELEEISHVRNHVLHARPATTEEGSQRLYRWRMSRGDQFWITDEWLRDALAQIEQRRTAIDALHPDTAKQE